MTGEGFFSDDSYDEDMSGYSGVVIGKHKMGPNNEIAEVEVKVMSPTVKSDGFDRRVELRPDEMWLEKQVNEEVTAGIADGTYQIGETSEGGYMTRTTWVHKILKERVAAYRAEKDAAQQKADAEEQVARQGSQVGSPAHLQSPTQPVLQAQDQPQGAPTEADLDALFPGLLPKPPTRAAETRQHDLKDFLGIPGLGMRPPVVKYAELTSPAGSVKFLWHYGAAAERSGMTVLVYDNRHKRSPKFVGKLLNMEPSQGSLYLSFTKEAIRRDPPIAVSTMVQSFVFGDLTFMLFLNAD